MKAIDPKDESVIVMEMAIEEAISNFHRKLRFHYSLRINLIGAALLCLREECDEERAREKIASYASWCSRGLTDEERKTLVDQCFSAFIACRNALNSVI